MQLIKEISLINIAAIDREQRERESEGEKVREGERLRWSVRVSE